MESGQLIDILLRYSYLFVFIITFLECGAFVGLFTPGETVVILGAILAAQGKLDPVLVFFSIIAGAYAGDLFGFWLGKRFGQQIILKIGKKIGYTETHFERTHLFFEKWGWIAITGGRFIGIFRSLLPATIGSIQYDFKRFALFDLIGVCAWTSAFFGLGYFLGDSWSYAKPYLTFLIPGLSIIGMCTLYFIFRKQKSWLKK